MATLVTDSGRKTPARLAGSAVMACQSDARLTELVHEGHERAFEAIVARYRKPLIRYCSGILPESRTEDAVQQAFINAHAALTAGETPEQLKAWLYRITRNAALNMLRQNGWNYEQIPLDFDGVRRPDQVVEQRIELQTTVAAVSALPDRQRDAIVMREFEGRSYEEIALALGANDGAVRQLLNRARGTLRTVATALMPPPIVTRIASSLPPSDGRRVAEIAGGLGAVGLAKAGATALVAGSLVVGAVKGPLPAADRAAAKDVQNTKRTSAASPTAAALLVGDDKSSTLRFLGGTTGSRRGASNVVAETRDRSGRSGSDDRSRAGSDDPAGSDDRTRSGSGDGSVSGDRSGSGDRSESGDRSGGRTGSGSDDRSGRSGSDDSTSGTSGGSGSSGSHGGDTSSSGTSGSGSSGGGSDDSSIAALTGSDSSGGSGTSGTSGTSGSDSSGRDSGTSGSGTSGSGSSGSGTSGSGTSGSGTSGSGKDSSGTSGSGGSGSDDPLEHR